jgi:SsrA-binding protein
MKKKKETEPRQKIAATNRKARHQYHILETIEAGIVLQGTEIKSIRQGKVSLLESFAQIKHGEVFLNECHISPYDHGGYANHEPKRSRKLLLHKKEIIRLFVKLQTKGYTLIPLKIYFTRGKAKVLLALAQGKKMYDKREDLKRRDMDREIERAKSEKY